MRYKAINNKLFIRNREKLVKLLPEKSIAIFSSYPEMFRNGDQNYPFRQNSDLFYFTGIEQEKTILVINSNAKEETDKEFLIVLKPNKKLETWNGKKLTKSEASKISGIKNIIWENDVDLSFKKHLNDAENIYLNIVNDEDLNDSESVTTLKVFKNIICDNPQKSIRSVNEFSIKLRLIKEPEEIELIKKAIDITKTAFFRVLNNIKPNIKEYEIEAELVCEFTKQGASGHAFAPIVASGKNACYLHYVKNDDVCKNNNLVLIDFGAEYANYSSDCSRTIPVNGKFTKRQKDVYNAVLRVQKKAIKLFVPGNSINKVNEQTAKWMEQELISLGLISDNNIKNQSDKNPAYKEYFMHGTSHFMGLDVHDVGGKDVKFEKGMVLTCEPGIYIKKEKIGIRLENDILVDDEPIDLMRFIPIEIDEIESLIK